MLVRVNRLVATLALLAVALAACGTKARTGEDYTLSNGEQRVAIRFEKTLLSMSLAPCDALIIKNLGTAPAAVNVNIWAIARVSMGDLEQELQVVVRNAPLSDEASAQPVLLDMGEGALIVGQWSTTQRNIEPAGSRTDCLANFPDLDGAKFKLKSRWLDDAIFQQ